MSLSWDNEDAAETAVRQLRALGLECEVEPSRHAEARAHWRVAVRMPQRPWFEIALRVAGVWVVLPNNGTASWSALRGDEFPTLHQAVMHYLLTVTQ
jgi:hypothetical protein